MYDVMVAWETMQLDDQPEVMRDFAEIWRAADKIVYSNTLETPSSARTRVERVFDHEAIRTLKSSAVSDIVLGTPTLTANAIQEGLVDEYTHLVVPVGVGGGITAFQTVYH